MTDSTLTLFVELWGHPAAQVHIPDSAKLLDAAWREIPSWAIIPFETLEPRWKVPIDGNSPIRKDFTLQTYPLRARFSFMGKARERLHVDLPVTNREGAKLTTVLMSGTSALVREIAYQMETKGISYPARDIGDWLRQADIFHVSHETSFDPTCPPPNPELAPLVRKLLP